MNINLQLEGLKHDGTVFPIELKISKTEVGEELFFTLAIRDISLRLQLEQEREKLAAFPHHNPSPTLSADIIGVVVYCNPAAELICQEHHCGVDELLPNNHLSLIELSRTTEASIQGESDVGPYVFQWSYRHLPNSQLVHIFAMDITIQRERQLELTRYAEHDALTGLPNRNWLLRELRDLVRVSGWLSNHAVLFMDVDRFKLVNDTLGHSLGDELLGAVARRISGCIQDGQTLARLGGDEFVVLYREFQVFSSVIDVANRIHDSLQQPLEVRGHQVSVSVGIGIAVLDPQHDRAEDVLRDANAAMYDAKSNGIGQTSIFDEDIRKQIVATYRLEDQLDRALRDQSFELHYQPIVNTDSLALNSVECQVRWRSDDGGLLSPQSFIDTAEQTGHIVQMGWLVLEQALIQWRTWRDSAQPIYPPHITVNVSPRQFQQPDFLTQLKLRMKAYPLPPGTLIIEVTENVFIEQVEHAGEILEQILDLGIAIHLDDFGTGYSSLGYQHSLPIDAIKIDRSFTSRIMEDKRTSDIVEAFIALASKLQMEVIAEGRDSESERSRLESFGCHIMQGALFSMLLSDIEMLQWISDHESNRLP